MELVGGVVFAVVFAGVLAYGLLRKKSRDLTPYSREELFRHYGVEVDPVDTTEYHSNTDAGDDNRFI